MRRRGKGTSPREEQKEGKVGIVSLLGPRSRHRKKKRKVPGWISKEAGIEEKWGALNQTKMRFTTR